jgi:transposase
LLSLSSSYEQTSAIWLPSKELLDLRALLLHRHQWVRLRTRIQNALQAIALANGLRRGPRLWSYDGQAKIAFLPLPPHASSRRSALQTMYRKLQEEIENLTEQIAEQARRRCGTQQLLTHPGVGPVIALATDVFLSDAQRFADGKARASYLRCCAFSGTRPALTRLAAIPNCSGSIAAN